MFGNFTLTNEQLVQGQDEVQLKKQLQQSETAQTPEKRKLSSEAKIVPQTSDIDDADDDGDIMQPRKIDQIITVGPSTMIR